MVPQCGSVRLILTPQNYAARVLVGALSCLKVQEGFDGIIRGRQLYNYETMEMGTHFMRSVSCGFMKMVDGFFGWQKMK